MEKGGILIVETINPCNYTAFFHNFIKDFTHKTPIHQDTLQFILEVNGFRILEVLGLSDVKEEDKLHYLKLDTTGLDKEAVEVYNRNVARLNTLLFGNQDFAIVAVK